MEKISWSQAQQQLNGFIYKRVRDHAAADDITQDVLIKIFSKMTQLQDTDRLSGWMYQIARNSIIDHFRARARNIPIEEINPGEEAPTLNECVEGCLKDMLHTLPDEYREALELVELGSLSQQALALKLGISYSGAKSRVQRARQMLRERMEESYLIELDNYGNVVTCENKAPCNCSHNTIV
jgi:RNA polymerase sigma-70 factor, ECF subfamily